ncbi:MAG: metallophosphoesterase [Balneolaceae bacterium]|nr:metallophosphoesterase [Balneolaceae bacterium]
MIRIYHTADLHIGLRFKNHPEASETLVQARYETLEKLVGMANEQNADIFAIAGDLFDRTSMKVSDIQRVIQTINKFEGKCGLGTCPVITTISPKTASSGTGSKKRQEETCWFWIKKNL